MDHISRALERATSDRGSVRSWVQPAAHGESASLAEFSARDVVVSRDVMKSNHLLAGDADEMAVVSDVYRLLRTRVVQSMRHEGWNALGITSPGPQAGKTLTAINFAITLARDSSCTVVLVDADLRKPSIAADLGISVEVGLIDYLKGDAAISDVMVRPDIANMIIVPGRREEAGSVAPELLTSTRMSDLIDGLRGRDASRMVVVDLPPVLVGDDVVATAPLLDALMMVVSEGHTLIDEVSQASELLRNFKILGTVLNRSAAQSRHLEGYYYPSGHAA